MKEVQKVLIITLFLNLFVAGFKIFYGYKSNLISMISDGFHSLMDSSSNIVALMAIYVSHKPPDEKHPYGHKKFEAFASMGISFLLFLTSYEIISGVLAKLNSNTVPETGIENIIVMVMTMLINVFVTKYETYKGNQLKNKLLLDDSSHTASDILVSLSVLISIIAIKLGYTFFDYIASGIIVFIIASVAWKILSESIKILSDSSVLDPLEIERVVINIEGVNSCHKVRTRGFLDNILVDLHIQVDPNITITEAHEIGHKVQDSIKNNIKGIYEVITHVEPSKH